MTQDLGVFGVDRPVDISFYLTLALCTLALYLSKKLFLSVTNLIDFLLTYENFILLYLPSPGRHLFLPYHVGFLTGPLFLGLV